MQTLVAAKKDTAFTVTRVNGTGAVRRRMLDMGITKGALIYFRKSAPFGDPIELRVRGCNITLRRKDAALIEAEVLKVTVTNGSPPGLRVRTRSVGEAKAI